MASFFTSRGRPVPFINVTPLIDVLLVLLIIFMMISPRKPHQFDSRIPDKPRDNEPQRVDLSSLVVTIPGTGGYLLNQTAVATREELLELLRKALDGRPAEHKTVFIKAPRGLVYAEVIKVVDVVKGAGAFPIGLQIEGLGLS
jgi:biopolymer transport protein ExbD